MASRFFFNGRLHTTPIAVSSVEDSRMSPQNPAVGNGLALVGLADAGEPGVPLTFSNPREAARVLKSGELLTAVRKGFSPSSSTGGPSKITVVRVGNASRSTLTLKDAQDAASIDLTSDLFGVFANQIRVKIEAGTLKGKRVTTRVGSEFFTADNLGRDAFTIRYTGTAAAATLDITGTTAVLKAGPAGALVVVESIPLASAPTVQQLVDRINSHEGFVATTVAGAVLVKTVNGLDGVTALDVKTSAKTVTADIAALIAWFNSNAEGFVTAKRAANAVAAPKNISDTYMAGATDPAVVLQDWMDAIDVLDSVDVQHIVALSADAAVHSALDAHCVFMSDAGRKERRAYVGPALGLTVAEAKQLPRTLSSHRTALCWPGHYDTDLDSGERVLLPPYMTAVHVAGGFAGLNPGNSMTNKAIRVQGLELNPSFPADTDALIESGVLTFESTPRGIKVCRSISTWLENDNFNRVEISTGIATDFVVRAVREALEPLVGSKASPAILDRAASVVETVLMTLARPEPGGPGVIVGDALNPAYQNIQCSIAGDVLNVAFECSPVVPVNFVALAVSVVPYQGSVAL